MSLFALVFPYVFLACLAACVLEALLEVRLCGVSSGLWECFGGGFLSRLFARPLRKSSGSAHTLLAKHSPTRRPRRSRVLFLSLVFLLCLLEAVLEAPRALLAGERPSF